MKPLAYFAASLALLMATPAAAAEVVAAEATPAASPTTTSDAAAEPAPPDSTKAEPAAAEPAAAEPVRLGLWNRPVRRGGFHLQVGFGIGGGPDTSGLFHTMELGWTFGDYTVAMLHTFIQNKGILGTNPAEPDLIGGWMAEFKAPLFFPDLVGKVALGLGGTHDQSNGIVAHPGFGASYGVDLHFPIWERFGPTLTIAALHVTALGQHHFGVGTALGVTLF